MHLSVVNIIWNRWSPPANLSSTSIVYSPFLYFLMPPQLSSRIQTIQNVRMASHGTSSVCDITAEYTSDCPRGVIRTISPYSNSSNSSQSLPPLALPSLTHPHIHLDKAFVYSAPQYAHLLPSTGSFSEALSFTAHAKAQFTHADVLQRGSWLLAESVAAGVTAMRAFVEVDHTVNLTCIAVGVTLKHEWQSACQIQLVCFAQDPVCSGEFGAANRHCIEEALREYSDDIAVLGTTPYVEATVDAAKENIEWAVARARELDKHLDFHLDYHLDPDRAPLIWHVLDTLRASDWTTRNTDKRVMLGHCTRLTLFSDAEWRQLAAVIREHDLPVSFVGMPTSDLYMAAAPTGLACRGTLSVPKLIREYGLDAVMGVNNVGNAFTPWGPADPLALACLGVGIYQAGTQGDAQLLYECVSTRARAAIGLASRDDSGLDLKVGSPADLLILHDVDDTGCGLSRPRKSVAEVVWDPPAKVCRDVICGGQRRISSTSLCPSTMYKYHDAI
ncbi:Metallo-dependent hydrolase [Aspergillus ambiguus]|uniref:putative zinc metallopeptidase n=1 Tax=Aspergillus ambiguus TaxID=176160 RepID=UPI003CCCADD4